MSAVHIWMNVAIRSWLGKDFATRCEKSPHPAQTGSSIPWKTMGKRLNASPGHVFLFNPLLLPPLPDA
jgi:hypothetical protein